MDISSSKEHSGLASSCEHEWEDIEAVPDIPQKTQSKGTKRLPRHRLLSYTCCLGKQRRIANPYFCNPIVSRLSTTEDLETFRNTVSNSRTFYASRLNPPTGPSKYPEGVQFPESELLQLDSSSLLKTNPEKKVTFANRKAVLIYNNHKSKKRPLSPQPESTYPEANHAGYTKALDYTKDTFFLHD